MLYNSQSRYSRPRNNNTNTSLPGWNTFCNLYRTENYSAPVNNIDWDEYSTWLKWSNKKSYHKGKTTRKNIYSNIYNYT